MHTKKSKKELCVPKDVTWAGCKKVINFYKSIFSRNNSSTMAAAFTTVSRSKTFNSIPKLDHKDSHLEVSLLPDEKDVEGQHSIEMLMLDGYVAFLACSRAPKFEKNHLDFSFVHRSWQARNMVWTKRFIFFSRTGEKVTIDTVPLHEILSLTSDHRRKRLNSALSLSAGSERIMSSPKIRSSHSSLRNVLANSPLFQIKTIPDGFNSGRTYSLQCESEEQLHNIMDLLEKNIHDAKKRVEARSRLRKSQDKVRKVYTSMLFQCGVAVLIMAVRMPFFLLSCFVAYVYIDTCYHRDLHSKQVTDKIRIASPPCSRLVLPS